MDETYDNDDHYDVTYVIVVFVAHAPAAVVPVFICQWILVGTMTAGGMKKLFLPSSDTPSPVSAVNNMHNFDPSTGGYHRRRSSTKRDRAEESANFHAVQQQQQQQQGNYVGRDPCMTGPRPYLESADDWNSLMRGTSMPPPPAVPAIDYQQQQSKKSKQPRRGQRNGEMECYNHGTKVGGGGGTRGQKKVRKNRKLTSAADLTVSCGNKLCEAKAAAIAAAMAAAAAEQEAEAVSVRRKSGSGPVYNATSTWSDGNNGKVQGRQQQKHQEQRLARQEQRIRRSQEDLDQCYAHGGGDRNPEEEEDEEEHHSYYNSRRRPYSPGYAIVV